VVGAPGGRTSRSPA